MMKSIICALLFITLSSIKAEDNPIGKTYKVQVRAYCQKTTNGGCMGYTDCVLTFKEETVIVTYNERGNCNTGNYSKPIKGIIYKWKLKNGFIHIYNFNIYGDFKIEKDKLSAHRKKNDTWERLDFKLTK